MMRAWQYIGLLSTLIAIGAQGVRWLRVLQREHYEPAAVARFFFRWAIVRLPSPSNRHQNGPSRWLGDWTITAAFCVALLLAGFDGAALAVAVGYGWWLPQRLTRRGRTSRLNWTRRLKTVAIVATVLELFILTGGFFALNIYFSMVAAIALVPAVIQLAAEITAPMEDRLAQKFVDQAARRLAEVSPTVVAITGSFGKTSTKHHLAELLGGRQGVVPTPRSFNNRAGLSRAINENLVSGTSVFIAEMGTYGPGEIRALCDWCPPEIAIVTSIGPVHLERMRTLDVIDQAKFEITERAQTVILNIDDVRLAAWVPTLEAAGKKVITAGSSSQAAQVRVVLEHERWKILRDDVVVAEVLPVAGIHETNLACAIAACFELGGDPYEVATRISHLTAAQHRLTVVRAPSGLTIIDDTFNANPASTTAALELLDSIPVAGHKVVITPGLIELGSKQVSENEALGRAIMAAGASLVVVGRTNVRSLTTGFDGEHLRFDIREQAVAWVRANLGETDVVLYLNDLPDHYP
ncbi:MAG: UDP-N-acetylmuramoyl-tripeptide--D-alanyl-D-alanine ligase [Actinomycetes bacterium]